VHKAGFHAFCMIFRRFFSKNRWKINEKNDAFFSYRRLFFSTWRPSRNTVFYNTKATFSFFAFLRFF
jgi:hypothetical protein